MSIPSPVIKYLDKNKVKYEILKHKTVYTTFDLAQTLKKKMSELAKTLLVKADKSYVLVVLPAHYKLSFPKLKKFLKAKKLEMAPENVMKKIFKVKPGAITPFAKLHKVEMVLDKGLLKLDKAIIRAGSYTESLHMKVKDLQEMEKGKIAAIGESLDKKLGKKKVAKKKKK